MDDAGGTRKVSQDLENCRDFCWLRRYEEVSCKPWTTSLLSNPGPALNVDVAVELASCGCKQLMISITREL